MLVNHIYQGDCIKVMKESIETGSIDLIFADPPYNLSGESLEWKEKKFTKVNEVWDTMPEAEYLVFTKDWLTECTRVLKPSGSIYVCASKHNLGIVLTELAKQGLSLNNIITWFKCLSGGTKLYVKSKHGETPMFLKDLVRLDPASVQLWTGEKWSKVLGWHKSEGNSSYYKITLRSGEVLRCTGDHRWPTKRGLITASQLVVGDQLVSVVLPEPKIVNTFDHLPDEDIGWFVGLYLAEGSLGSRGKTIQISGHADETSERMLRLKKIVEGYNGTVKSYDLHGASATINITGAILLGILKTYLKGKDSYTKHLSTKAWNRSNVFIRSLLMGYLHGDGHFDQFNNRYRLVFTGKNHQLANDLRTICARLNLRISLKRGKATCGESVYPVFRGEIRLTNPRSNSLPRTEIVSISTCRKSEFWDIEIEDESHTFALASGILTHNSNAMPSKQCRTYTHACEYIAYAVKGTGWTYNYDDLKKINTDRQQSGDLKAMRDMWIMPKCAGKERIIDPQTGKAAHSTQKPLRLVNNCVIASSLPGEIVLDPFMGSGTTAESCMRLNRKFVGIDLEEKYVKISNDRIIKTASELAASLHSGTSSSRRSLAS